MLPKGGLQSMMKKAQKLQEKMQKAQEELVNIEAEGQSGGGLVTVISNGKKEIKSVKIYSSAGSIKSNLKELNLDLENSVLLGSKIIKIRLNLLKNYKKKNKFN